MKNYYFVFMFITLAFATPTGDLKDFTEMVSIRSLETGIFKRL